MLLYYHFITTLLSLIITLTVTSSVTVFKIVDDSGDSGVVIIDKIVGDSEIV